MDERFEAYRSGHLSADDELGLETQLAQDGAARHRLALRAGIAVSEASPELRQRILGEFPRLCRPRALEVATRMASEVPS